MAVPLRSAVVLVGAAVLGALASESKSEAAQAPSGPVLYDVVLSHGRVMDPESGLDAIRNVGIEKGRIAAISEKTLAGRETLDVSGLVIAPGFIDLHAHGQDQRSAALQAHDGVTTALDMESGVFPVTDWYKSREGKAPIHFGASAGHVAARMKLKHGIDVGHRPTDHAHPELVTQ